MIDFFAGASQKDIIELISLAAGVTDAATFGPHIKDAVAPLTEFLAGFAMRDSAVVETACVVFSKLLNNLSANPSVVREVAAPGLPPVLLRILSAQPIPVGTKGVTAALSSLVCMASTCEDIAVQLLQDDALLPLLRAALRDSKQRVKSGSGSGAAGAGTGDDSTPAADGEDGDDGEDGEDGEDIIVLDTSTGELDASTATATASATAEAQGRMDLTASQLVLVVRLVRATLPRLPRANVFAAFRRDVLPPARDVVWQWQNGTTWVPYSPAVSAHLEHAVLQGQQAVQVSSGSRVYAIDLRRMHQMNAATHTMRAVRRVQQHNEQAGQEEAGSADHTVSTSAKHGNLATFYAEHEDLLCDMISKLLKPLFELYLSTAQQELHSEFAEVLVRMITGATPATLKASLKTVAVSRYLAQMLHSRDAVLLMAALAATKQLLDKLPSLFQLHFQRKGVLHRIEQLTRLRIETVASSSATASATASATSSSSPAARAPPTAAERRAQHKRALGHVYDFARSAFADVLAAVESNMATDPTLMYVFVAVFVAVLRVGCVCMAQHSCYVFLCVYVCFLLLGWLVHWSPGMCCCQPHAHTKGGSRQLLGRWRKRSRAAMKRRLRLRCRSWQICVVPQVTTA